MEKEERGEMLIASGMDKIPPLYRNAVQKFDNEKNVSGVGWSIRKVYLVALKSMFYHINNIPDAHWRNEKAMQELKETLKNTKCKPLKKINKDDVMSWLAALNGNLESGTLNVYKVAVKNFFQWVYELKKDDYPQNVDWIEFAPVKCNLTRNDLPTPEEVKKMIESCGGNFRDRALISTLYDSQCRAAEILGLQIKDIKEDNYGFILTIRGKGDRYREVRLVESDSSIFDDLVMF